MRKFTIEEVRETCEQKDLTLISTEYVDVKSPLAIICNKHKDKGIQYKSYDRLRQNKYGCIYCANAQSGICSHIDIEIIKKECKKSNFEFIDIDYSIPRARVRYICNNHREKGIQEKPIAALHKSSKAGHGCPYCSKVKRTKEDFLEFMETEHPNIQILDYTFQSLKKSRIKCQCKICGNIWITSGSSLVAPHGCPKCPIDANSKIRTKTHDQYEQQLKSIHPNIQLLSQYTTSKGFVKCKCLDCGNIWEANSGSLLTLVYGCPKCATKVANIKSRVSNEEYKERLSKYNPNVEMITDYEISSKKIKFRCKIHNTEFYQLPAEVMYKCGCSKCMKKSFGEIRIEDYLKINHIKYETQKTFEGCKNIRKLPFDFHLPDYNMAIEYDGKLHFEAIDYFGGEEELAERQRLDKIKTDYCKNNNIRLLRIPYWDFDNIENILQKELNI